MFRTSNNAVIYIIVCVSQTTEPDTCCWHSDHCSAFVYLSLIYARYFEESIDDVDKDGFIALKQVLVLSSTQLSILFIDYKFESMKVDCCVKLFLSSYLSNGTVTMGDSLRASKIEHTRETLRS